MLTIVEYLAVVRGAIQAPGEVLPCEEGESWDSHVARAVINRLMLFGWKLPVVSLHTEELYLNLMNGIFHV